MGKRLITLFMKAFVRGNYVTDRYNYDVQTSRFYGVMHHTELSIADFSSEHPIGMIIEDSREMAVMPREDAMQKIRKYIRFGLPSQR